MTETSIADWTETPPSTSYLGHVLRPASCTALPSLRARALHPSRAMSNPFPNGLDFRSYSVPSHLWDVEPAHLMIGIPERVPGKPLSTETIVTAPLQRRRPQTLYSLSEGAATSRREARGGGTVYTAFDSDGEDDDDSALDGDEDGEVEEDSDDDVSETVVAAVRSRWSMPPPSTSPWLPATPEPADLKLHFGSGAGERQDSGIAVVYPALHRRAPQKPEECVKLSLGQRVRSFIRLALKGKKSQSRPSRNSSYR
ncbi:hypothetical protein DFJ73DRAFT_839667 [Zopfochytrium polystomum]|nr:hypothetical protein DFJ73DRAFT_839667 [Zopfochytrium polystomum]